MESLPPECAAKSLCRGERPAPRRFKLRAIGDLPPPCLATGEGSRAGRFPKHRDTPLGSRADEVPLPPAEMARDRFQIDPLVQIAELQTKPAAPGIRHIGGDFAGRNFLIQIAITPTNSGARLRAGPNQFLTDALIQIEL